MGTAAGSKLNTDMTHERTSHRYSTTCFGLWFPSPHRDRSIWWWLPDHVSLRVAGRLRFNAFSTFGSSFDAPKRCAEAKASSSKRLRPCEGGTARGGSLGLAAEVWGGAIFCSRSGCKIGLWFLHGPYPKVEDWSALLVVTGALLVVTRS